MKLCLFKVRKSDACIRPLFANSVTIVSYSSYIASPMLLVNTYLVPIMGPNILTVLLEYIDLSQSQAKLGGAVCPWPCILS